MPKRIEPSKTTKQNSKTSRDQPSNNMEQIRSALPIFYTETAWTYLDAGGELNSYILDSYLPGRTLELAHSFGLVSPSNMAFSIPISHPPYAQDLIRRQWPEAGDRLGTLRILR